MKALGVRWDGHTEAAPTNKVKAWCSLQSGRVNKHSRKLGMGLQLAPLLLGRFCVEILVLVLIICYLLRFKDRSTGVSIYKGELGAIS